jgi:putative tryptophan/tyrosine transport system substrate-binding protein
VKRREFITLLGGAAAWPLAARAQQPGMPVIGLLSSRSSDEAARSVAALRAGLDKAGYIEGQNVAIEYRWAEGHYDRLPALAVDLTRRRVAVIVAMGGEPSALAANAATQTIPIVFNSGGDPVEAGLVASLNRPGGNATGVSMLFVELGPKQLELLQELVPKIGVIAVLVNQTFVSAEKEAKDALAAGRALGKQVHIVSASSESEIDTAFGDLVKNRTSALMVAPDPFLFARREHLVALAARHAVPTIYFSREFPEAGGLMSYGTSIAETTRVLSEPHTSGFAARPRPTPESDRTRGPFFRCLRHLPSSRLPKFGSQHLAHIGLGDSELSRYARGRDSSLEGGAHGIHLASCQRDSRCVLLPAFPRVFHLC